ncbi:hypothetical protein AHiyo8_38820 [Arthrobacter sp. Hiyo8]|nr:hypothetical protein AHiyo8_38820 [Arthrobacter sp. Hiyo8]
MIDVVGVPPQLIEVSVHANPRLLAVSLGELVRRRALLRSGLQQHLGP